jgi:hypothetical protein
MSTAILSRLTIPIVALTLCACRSDLGANDATNAVGELSLNLSSHESYQRFLDTQINLYKKRNFDKIISNTPYGDRFSVHETPTYFHYVFHAVEPLSAGDHQAAKDILTNFDLMLEIDLGSVRCSEGESDYLVLENGTKIQNTVVSSYMCHEAFLGYWENPNEKLLSEISRYKMISDDIKILLEK